MGEKVDQVPFFWVEESNEQLYLPMTAKRKLRSKKIFYGWGSKPLIEFLDSIGKDTSEKLSQHDVTTIITEYVKENNLIHPEKKKRILCDDRLHYLFGRKSVSRIKIYDLLEAHFAENEEESEDQFVYSSEEKEQKTLEIHRQPKISSSERRAYQRKNFLQTSKSCFAAITSENIKLVYLKRSLVQDLLKEPESFETKIIGSFVRVKSDPNDYFQKNSHQLLLVTGLKKATGIGDGGTEILLQISNLIKDVRICMLSDENFSQEECEDLQRRVKEGLLKRPTVVELEEKAQILHEDITKHWIVRELALLQNLIDRANEKGWRKELFEYLEKRQLLQTPSEQSRLLCEAPKVIADEIELETTRQNFPDNVEEGNDNSPRSFDWVASEIAVSGFTAEETPSARATVSTDDGGIQAAPLMSEQKNNLEGKVDVLVQLVSLDKDKGIQGRTEGMQQQQQQGMAAQVIDLSSDDEEEEEEVVVESPPRREIVDKGVNVGSLIWHYRDPQGVIQGPFSMLSLKSWSDANYFDPDFKVWMTGQTPEQAVLLTHFLRTFFPTPF
ncbi:uncharacterized protein At5g08430 [Malania oleifera]|uniref:uncharacterized protein At5g08430 n=1 Tax=Malania oleifera TaxID=397392 RepID=UPI0025AE73BE|nr:uncharacterized protein At5g08430 [Malania oleifera]